MSITHRASVISGKFSFEGFASSEEGARLALRRTLALHAARMKIASEWIDETMAKTRVSAVAAGVAMFDSDDGDGVFHVAGDPTGAEVSVRVQVDVRGPSGWGVVETYGATEKEARDMATAAVRSMVDAGAATSVEEMMEDAYAYSIRDGGGYRGGATGSAGEAMLDGHMEPSLPEGDVKWLPTICCRIMLTQDDVVLSDMTAYGRPTRLNKRNMITFITDDLEDAMTSTMDAIRDPALRDGAERSFDIMLGSKVPDAFLRLKPSRDQFVLADGSTVSIEFTIVPTTAADLVTQKA